MRKLKILIITFILILNFSLPAFSSDRWEYEVLDLPQTTINNQIPIKIAIIDSGVIDNDYLRPFIIKGYNFIDNNENYIDTFGHGTKVSGILIDLAKETGLNIKLISLKTVNSEGASSTVNVIRAINYAIEQKVDIINISMTNKNDTPELLTAVQNAQTNNILIVAGAGNNGQEINLYPASYDNVLSVGSIDQVQKISWFSNFNDEVSIVAPGEKITTMELDGSYGLHSGTSFSTPFATFEVALLKAKYPELDNDQIIQVINETAIDTGNVDKDNYYGNGIINYNIALNNTSNALKQFTKWEPKINVVTNKVFTVNFNNTIKSNGDILVIDEEYNSIPIDIQTSDNKLIITPTNNYLENTIYSLIIEDTISSNDIKLKNNVKMKFKTNDGHSLMNIYDAAHELPSLMPY